MDELLTVEELESRMRPLHWSHEGFLGPSERLMSVIEQDAATLSCPAEMEVPKGVAAPTFRLSVVAEMWNVVAHEGHRSPEGYV